MSSSVRVKTLTSSPSRCTWIPDPVELGVDRDLAAGQARERRGDVGRAARRASAAPAGRPRGRTPANADLAGREGRRRSARSSRTASPRGGRRSAGRRPRRPRRPPAPRASRAPWRSSPGHEGRGGTPARSVSPGRTAGQRARRGRGPGAGGPEIASRPRAPRARSRDGRAAGGSACSAAPAEAGAPLPQPAAEVGGDHLELGGVRAPRRGRAARRSRRSSPCASGWRRPRWRWRDAASKWGQSTRSRRHQDSTLCS